MNEEPIHCLIADDDEYIATFLQEAISDYAELTTTVVANAEEALDLFSTGIPIEILLTDLHMPGIGGEELIARIHKISPKTLIIVITGNSSIDTAVHLIKEGAYDYLTKPIEITDYLQAVDKAIEQVYAIRNKDFSSDIGKMWHISQLMDKNLTSDKILQGIVDNAIKMSQAQGGILYYFSNDTWETRIKINVSDVQNKIILQNILRAPWENLQ
ncbi:MAG TPA: response regulator, partial [Planctomycetota bacterium]|nr:response regulator [Planctomycetota bacterium]